MLIPIIQRFHSSKTPWQVYQNFYSQSQVSFFLDSHDYLPPNQTYSYLGCHPFLEVVLQNHQIKVSGEKTLHRKAKDLFPLLRKLFRSYSYSRPLRKPFFTGGAVGYWGYELAAYFDRIRWRKKPAASKIPWLYLGFYKDLIVYDHKKRVYWLVTHVTPSQKRNKKIVKAAFEKLKSYFQDQPITNGRFQLKQFQPDTPRPMFEKMVRRAKEYIAAGDIYQANLSQKFSFTYSGSSLKLYEALRKINPSPFASLMKIHGLDIVSSSPERLIHKRGNLCETLPIAGTRPRRAGKEKKMERELFLNEKERAEHIMLVDLERNDLGRVCDWPTVQVEEMMKIEKYSHVIHLVSRITGKLRKGQDAFDLIRAVFPGGTITGCPKIRCMEIIDELESTQRGLYTGSMGYIDFNGDMDLNIVIRTLLLNKNRGCLQVGAGIVHDSDPAKEYEETLHKGEALVSALAQASTS